jgi:hypothetical protein
MPAAVSASKTAPWLLLFGRTGLFIAFQGVFALGARLAGAASAWESAAAWWPFVVTIVNLICVGCLIALFGREGKRYWDIFRIRRENVKGDLLALLGTLFITGPLGVLPNILLASWLFDSSQTVLDMLIRPLPLWAVVASLVFFPITQGLAELPTYFGYVMPRLGGRTFPDLRPVILPGLMLGLQHFAIPLLFDLRFITWRAFMYLPFALATGAIIHWRPRLMPYLVLIHILMDLSFATMLLEAAY